MSSVLSLVAATTSDPIFPDEITTEILLRLPTNSLLKLMCVSKLWYELISSPHFVNTHLKLTANDKECSHHKVLSPGIKRNFKFCSLPPLFNNQQGAELFRVDSPIINPMFLIRIVGSVNGLVCLFNGERETYIWNPTIRKSKELLNFRRDICSYHTKYGFAYDESHDNYKVIFIDYISSSNSVLSTSNPRTVVSIYSVRTDSSRTVHDQLQSIYLVSSSGKFANGKLYWAASTDLRNDNVCNIMYFDVADETWGSLELPISGEGNSYIKLGVMGRDLSLLHTCRLGATSSDVWIMKHCGVNVSWTKLFTISFPRNAGLRICYPPKETFAMHFRQSYKGDILLLLPPVIMIYDGSTRELKHTVDIKGHFRAEEVYVESLVNPLILSDQGRRIHETA